VVYVLVRRSTTQRPHLLPDVTTISNISGHFMMELHYLLTAQECDLFPLPTRVPHHDSAIQIAH
jgi:hypothetical protein